jgi:hypothetical protein
LGSLKRSTQNLQLSTSSRPITPSIGSKPNSARLVLDLEAATALPARKTNHSFGNLLLNCLISNLISEHLQPRKKLCAWRPMWLPGMAG